MSDRQEPSEYPPYDLSRLMKGCWGLELLHTGELAISYPSDLNDPFELSMRSIDCSSLNVACARKLLGEQGSLLYDKDFENLGLTDEECLKEVERRCRETPGILKNRLSEYYGLICFSCFANDKWTQDSMIRHFAHYGDNHSGAAIFFDPHHSLFSSPIGDRILFPVNYNPDRPSLSLKQLIDAKFDKVLESIVKTLARRKSKAWVDEDEWRLILPFLNHENPKLLGRIAGGRLRYFWHLWDNSLDDDNESKARGAKAIKRVVLGCRAEPELIRDLSATLRRKHLEHVGIYQAVEHPEEFSLQYEPINAPARAENLWEWRQ